MVDYETIERDLRAWVADRLGRGAGLPASRRHEAVAATATLTRIGLSIPDLDELEAHILSAHGVTLVIGGNERIRDIAEGVERALATKRRAA